MVWLRIRSLLLGAAILDGFLKGVFTQQEAETTQATSIYSIIDYSLTLYILIGIAVVYSIITLICCVLVVLNCCCRKAERQQRVSPYADLTKRPLRPPRLETIYEEGESKCSSLTSLAVAKQQALTFYNQDAIATVESGEKETEMGSSKDIIREPDVEGTVSIVNKSALDQDSSSDEELRDKGKVQSSDVSSGTRKQTPSFSNRTALERESSEEDKATKKGAVPAIHLASDVSSSSARRHTLSFSNRTALERENSGEDKTTTKGAVLTVGLASDVSGSPRKHALSFSNRTALERENSEEGKATNDSGKLERGTDITASFRRPVPLGKMNEKEAPNIQTSSRGSPFLQHIPRGAFVSPADVKVPYTADWEEPKPASTGKQDFEGDTGPPSRSRPPSVSSTENPASTRSPFSKRKNQAKEIPSSEASTLTKYKKKTSTSGLPPSSTIQSQEEGTSHSTGKVVLPPIEAMSSLHSSGVTSQSEGISSGSPARSRPKPLDPVISPPTGSPFLAGTKLKPLRGRAWSQGSSGGATTKGQRHSTDLARSESPLRKAKASKDSTPGIVAHSLSASEQSKSSETPGSSIASISSTASMLVTVDVLAKKLEPVQRKWYIIGSQLKVPSRCLNQIRNANKSNSESCLSMCEEWVSKFKEAATWPKVVDALKTDLVDEKVLGCDLEREFCWVESNNSKTWL